MSTFLQQLVNGISLGSTYAVFAMGCTLIFGVLNIVNMAQGAFFMGGAYFGLEAARLGLPAPLALAVALAGGGLLGMLSELVIFRTLRARGGHRWMGLVASLALARMMVGLAQEIFGTQVQRYPASDLMQISWEIADVRIQLLQVVLLVVSLLLMALLAFVLQRSSIGRAIRTVAFSEDVARIVGVPVGRTILATFFLAGALAGAAGMLLGNLFNVVSPFMGEQMLVKGLTVIILGGLGNVPGAVAGGFLLGLIEVFSVAYVSSSFRDAIGFGLIFVILLVKPNGLFSGFEERRA
ncbi:branched-chain amino acid ABC transporter permease [Bradyrhizobium sp. Leo121]|uniref:branched-chain amino acid ABC transporter permease n=1 Tax=Bradyrhizobium sp. Leo121 TaxID=1571195 RepID=UPI00102A446A|nr:branched-chain amino acid ABC transporter permease [Bradyrhizobium sp. Leo121]RZN31959.1 branched-chain amino acid ABC transporter permease [Bradyrhizobium sp. Leo121]